MNYSKTYIVLMSAMIFSILAYGAVHQPIIVALYLLILLALLLWSVDSIRQGNFVISRSPIQIPIFLLGLYGFVQIIPFGTISTVTVDGVSQTISVDPFSTLMASINIVVLAIFLSLVLAVIDSPKRMRTCVWFLTAFGAIYAFYAILQSVLSPGRIYGIYDASFTTPFGSFVNRHNFAAIIEMLIALPLGLLITGAVARDKRLIIVVAISIMAIALLLSGSRGGTIAAAAQVVLLLLITKDLWNKRSAMLIRGLLTLALVAIPVFGTLLIGGESSLSRLTETPMGNDLTSQRSTIWSASVNVIGEHIPFGAGLGGFGVAYTKYDPTGGYYRVDQAHNDYLQLVTDAGLPGIIIFAAYIWAFVAVSLRALRTRNVFRRGIGVGAIVGCWGILVHSLFDFVLHIPAVALLFLFLLGIAVAAGRKYDDEITDFDEPKLRRRKKAEVKEFERVADARSIT